MPSAAPLTSTTAPLASPAPVAMTTAPTFGWPAFGPTYPKAGPVGMLVVALTYFSLGVAVGALLKQSTRGRRWLPFVVVPGLILGLVFLLWVLRTLR